LKALASRRGFLCLSVCRRRVVPQFEFGSRPRTRAVARFESRSYSSAIRRIATLASGSLLPRLQKTKDDFRRMRCLPLPESHIKIISICSDRASPNSTVLTVRSPTPGLSEPDDSPCATTKGQTYRQSRRAGGRASTNMVEVLNPTVREPWQKLKEYFMN